MSTKKTDLLSKDRTEPDEIYHFAALVTDCIPQTIGSKHSRALRAEVSEDRAQDMAEQLKIKGKIPPNKKNTKNTGPKI